MKYTKHTLKKTELLLEEIGYVIRYEKGSFQSGYAVVQKRKIAVINKFFDTEARINCLFDIIAAVEVDTARLSDKSVKFYNQMEQNKAEEAQLLERQIST
ncbi:MAG: hypothetical protein AAF738_02390 [Bacteroidota bacterium]